MRSGAIDLIKSRQFMTTARPQYTRLAVQSQYKKAALYSTIEVSARPYFTKPPLPRITLLNNTSLNPFRDQHSIAASDRQA